MFRSARSQGLSISASTVPRSPGFGPGGRASFIILGIYLEIPLEGIAHFEVREGRAEQLEPEDELVFDGERAQAPVDCLETENALSRV